MSFEWDRIYKWEENVEREVTDSVYKYVCEYYDVEEIHELNEEQVLEIQDFFRNRLNEYSVMQIGFSNLLNSVEV